MAVERDISQVQRQTQERIFRVALAQGLTLKAISLDSGIPYSTLRTYAGQNGSTAIMGVDALFKLVGVIPDELLSLLLPGGRVIVRVPDEIDHDEMEEMCRSYLAEKGRAHHPDSPAGRELSECEIVKLNAKGAWLGAVAS